MLTTLKNAFKIKELREKILFTFAMMVVIRIGSQLPVPGVNGEYFRSWFAAQSEGAFSFFDVITGGSFINMSILALNINPYITSSIIMQVDSPQKLYNEPNNLFVAGFIGSPQMNFVDAVCKVNGDAVTLSFEKSVIPLPPAKAKKLIDGGYNGKTVILGIRPEAIADTQIQVEAYKDSRFEADITGYELLGSEVILYFKVAGANMCARVEPKTTARVGDRIALAMDPEKIHVFDKETELTICN